MYATPSIRRRNALPSALAATCGRIAFTIFLVSILLAGAAQLRAQSEDSQRSSKDVAEAARQGRARKQRSAKHVYTNEDLRRGKILTPEDQSRAAAANHKNSTAPFPAAAPETQPLDANATAPQEPLGDVAQRYRNAKKNSPFHLPSSQTALATPKIIAPLVKPNADPRTPRLPRNFIALKPTAPRSRTTEPTAPSLPSPHTSRIDPFVARRTQPVPPSVATISPVEPRYTARQNSLAPGLQPLASLSSASVIVVRPGDTLWNLSRQHLGHGTRWLELLAANPSVEDPMRLVPGTQLVLPARTSSHRHFAQTITIQAGDSLSKLALAAYGRASYWPCLASANPSLTNPHQLHIGQSVVVPPSCTP